MRGREHYLLWAPFRLLPVPCHCRQPSALPPTPHTAAHSAARCRSCTGAIGPLLRYLRDNKRDDAALRSGLHTLTLLVSNSPNRGIIVSFHVSVRAGGRRWRRWGRGL